MKISDDVFETHTQHGWKRGGWEYKRLNKPKRIWSWCRNLTDRATFHLQDSSRTAQQMQHRPSRQTNKDLFFSLRRVKWWVNHEGSRIGDENHLRNDVFVLFSLSLSNESRRGRCGRCSAPILWRRDQSSSTWARRLSNTELWNRMAQREPKTQVYVRQPKFTKEIVPQIPQSSWK